MNSWTVEALLVGRAPGRPKASITYMHNWYEKIDLAMYMFLVRNESMTIMVDTGSVTPEEVRDRHPHNLVQHDYDRPAARLEQAGVDPKDVSTVINTHLHWDHCGNNDLFTEADVYVQRRELAYAASPVPMHTRGYEKIRGVTPQWLGGWDRIHAVDGDMELFDGIRLITLPGHTPGSQGVLVETSSGPVLIAGDCVDTYENWQGYGAWQGQDAIRHIPPGGHTNLIDCFASFDKIESLNCEVIPSHDVALEGKVWK